MEASKEWNKIFTNPDENIDLEIINRDVVNTAARAMEKFPAIGAFVLECTDLPPFSQAIRMATGKPVFDFQTLMGSVARSLGVVPAY